MLARLPIAPPPRRARVRRVAERNLHLTLKFLGDVEDARIPGLIQALAAASERVTTFDLVVERVGSFPERGAPRVLWAGCDGGAMLTRLHDQVETACERAGFPREERAFHPHVTLGRVTGCCRVPLLAAVPLERPFGRCRVDRVLLMESMLDPGGAIHRELHAVALAHA